MTSQKQLTVDFSPPNPPQTHARWRSFDDALADLAAAREGKPMTRFVMPGHPDWMDAPVAVRVTWMKDVCTVQVKPVTQTPSPSPPASPG